MPDKVAEALTRGVFDKVDDVKIGQVSDFAANWIIHHGIRTEARKGRKET